MYVVGITVISLLYEVYQCIFVYLKCIWAIQIRSIIIERLRQNSPTTFPAFLLLRMSAGYGIKHFVHIFNFLENQAPIFLTDICSIYRVVFLLGRIIPVFYPASEIELWCGWHLEVISI